jgi:hypothetical protein
LRGFTTNAKCVDEHTQYSYRFTTWLIDGKK